MATSSDSNVKPVQIDDSDSGVTYRPILGGWEATADTGEVRHIYLNPSGGSDDGVACVFLYVGPAGDLDQDAPVVHFDLFDDDYRVGPPFVPAT
jgi:uncharacterized protein YcnI